MTLSRLEPVEGHGVDDVAVALDVGDGLGAAHVPDDDPVVVAAAQQHVLRGRVPFQDRDPSSGKKSRKLFFFLFEKFLASALISQINHADKAFKVNAHSSTADFP
jgi:hypothetical protein